MSFYKIIFVLLSLAGSLAWSESGLVIHAAEIGVGKFHRYDNGIHPYTQNGAWSRYILAKDAGTKTPQVVPQFDGSVTIFFSTLKELLTTAVKLAQEKNSKISYLDVNSHGTPGGTWFPKDSEQLSSPECLAWNYSADADDKENYQQYYSAVSKEEIMDIRATSQHLDGHFGCVSGLSEWQEIAGQIPQFKDFFAADAQIHFFSCNVGLGPRGEQFTQGLAKIFLSSEQGRIETSLPLGLGDWSMPDGMGFWDYQNDEQLDRDNANYLTQKEDRTQMQKGSIRVATLGKDLAPISGLITDVDFIFNYADDRPFAMTSEKLVQEKKLTPMPFLVRIPGTRVSVIKK